MAQCMKQRGFSLVDAMVGMVISLIGIIIIFQVFEVSESRKRTTVGGSDVQSNGAIAVFMLEKALREAGYGINNPDDFAVASTTRPVQITFGANAKTPDGLVIMARPWDYGPYVPASAVYPAPVTTTYSINAQAQLVESVGGASAVPVVDGAVQLKALYGRDANGNGVVDGNEWDATDPAAGAWQSVLAIRLALVLRSAQAEGKDPATCISAAALPSWFGGDFDLSGKIGLTATDSERCYRYKTFETTVPLRNVIWRLQQ